MSTSLWTIGHSNHNWSKFTALLGAADIGVVVDVRSSPASRFPHFNRAHLRTKLNDLGISYVYLGLELGGRPRNGKPDYEVMATSPLFNEGLRQVEEIAGRARLALLCSEAEPLECHRCLLLGRRLGERGASVAHILRDGGVEAHAATEERLLKLTKRAGDDLLMSRPERLAHAYREQNFQLRPGRTRQRPRRGCGGL